MLLELVVLFLFSGAAGPSRPEPILIPVSAADLDRCRLTVEQVLAGPMLPDDTPMLALGATAAREVRCVVEPG